MISPTWPRRRDRMTDYVVLAKARKAGRWSDERTEHEIEVLIANNPRLAESSKSDCRRVTNPRLWPVLDTILDLVEKMRVHNERTKPVPEREKAQHLFTKFCKEVLADPVSVQEGVAKIRKRLP